MADLIRSTKSANNWIVNDLDAYNIRISTVNTQEFFGVSDLPAPTVDPIILNNVEAPVGTHLPRDVRLFFRLLRDAPRYDEAAQEILFVDDFSLHLLGPLLHIDEPDRVLHQRDVLPFVVNRDRVDAKFEITLGDSKGRTVIIQENKVSSLLFLTITAHHP
jgi:hypothetical protein